MANNTKRDNLIKELVALGKTPDELKDLANPVLEKMVSDLSKVAAQNDGEEMTEEEKAELKRISDEANKAIQNQKPPVRESEEAVYTKSDVKAILAEFQKDLEKKKMNDDDDEDEGPRKHTVRMSRINGKFIIGLKNQNKDEYFPDRVVYATDIFNEQTKQFIPHITLILEKDENTKEGEQNMLTLPLETAFKISKSVECELIERKKIDASEKYGQIEVQEIGPDQYAMKGTGMTVQGKAKIWKETYVVKLPTGTVVEVIPDVVNW